MITCMWIYHFPPLLDVTARDRCACETIINGDTRSTSTRKIVAELTLNTAQTSKLGSVFSIDRFQKVIAGTTPPKSEPRIHIVVPKLAVKE